MAGFLSLTACAVVLTMTGISAYHIEHNSQTSYANQVSIQHGQEYLGQPPNVPYDPPHYPAPPVVQQGGSYSHTHSHSHNVVVEPVEPIVPEGFKGNPGQTLPDEVVQPDRLEEGETGSINDMTADELNSRICAPEPGFYCDGMNVKRKCAKCSLVQIHDHRIFKPEACIKEGCGSDGQVCAEGTVWDGNRLAIGEECGYADTEIGFKVTADGIALLDQPWVVARFTAHGFDCKVDERLTILIHDENGTVLASSDSSDDYTTAIWKPSENPTAWMQYHTHEVHWLFAKVMLDFGTEREKVVGRNKMPYYTQAFGCTSSKECPQGMACQGGINICVRCTTCDACINNSTHLQMYASASCADAGACPTKVFLKPYDLDYRAYLPPSWEEYNTCPPLPAGSDSMNFSEALTDFFREEYLMVGYDSEGCYTLHKYPMARLSAIDMNGNILEEGRLHDLAGGAPYYLQSEHHSACRLDGVNADISVEGQAMDDSQLNVQIVLEKEISDNHEVRHYVKVTCAHTGNDVLVGRNHRGDVVGQLTKPGYKKMAFKKQCLDDNRNIRASCCAGDTCKEVVEDCPQPTCLPMYGFNFEQGVAHSLAITDETHSTYYLNQNNYTMGISFQHQQEFHTIKKKSHILPSRYSRFSAPTEAELGQRIPNPYPHTGPDPEFHGQVNGGEYPEPNPQYPAPEPPMPPPPAPVPPHYHTGPAYKPAPYVETNHKHEFDYTHKSGPYGHSSSLKHENSFSHYRRGRRSVDYSFGLGQAIQTGKVDLDCSSDELSEVCKHIQSVLSSKGVGGQQILISANNLPYDAMQSRSPPQFGSPPPLDESWEEDPWHWGRPGSDAPPQVPWTERELEEYEARQAAQQ